MDIGTFSDTPETEEDLKDIELNNEDSENGDKPDENKVLTETPDFVLSNIVKSDTDEEKIIYEMLDFEYGGRKLPQMIKVRRKAKSVCNICGHKAQGVINAAR